MPRARAARRRSRPTPTRRPSARRGGSGSRPTGRSSSSSAPPSSSASSCSGRATTGETTSRSTSTRPRRWCTVTSRPCTDRTASRCEQSAWHTFSPYTYGWGFPLLLAPLYAALRHQLHRLQEPRDRPLPRLPHRLLRAHPQPDRPARRPADHQRHRPRHPLHVVDQHRPHRVPLPLQRHGQPAAHRRAAPRGAAAVVAADPAGAPAPGRPRRPARLHHEHPHRGLPPAAGPRRPPARRDRRAPPHVAAAAGSDSWPSSPCRGWRPSSSGPACGSSCRPTPVER